MDVKYLRQNMNSINVAAEFMPNEFLNRLNTMDTKMVSEKINYLEHNRNGFSILFGINEEHLIS